jgi:hypothetical protein
VLRGRGYPIVDVEQDANAGNYPRSLVVAHGIKRAAAVEVALVLGLPANAASVGGGPGLAGVDIIVTLGDDAAR